MNILFHDRLPATTGCAHFSRLGLVAIVCCVLTGCGRGSSSPSLSPVSGRISVEGVPVSEGVVTFVPLPNSGTSGPAFTADIREDGTFELQGPGGASGAIPGQYRVVIQTPPISSAELMQSPRTGKLKRSDYVQNSPIPKTYQSPQSTPIKVTVAQETENRFDLQLTTDNTLQLSRSTK